MIVTDKYGNRVTRANGVLQDGDRMTVKINMMDGIDPTLAKAAAAAEAARRVEAFDAGLHPQAARYGKTADSSHDARERRDARMIDAWKNPPSVAKGDATALETVKVVGPSAPVEQLIAARDQAHANRDKRLERAWQA